jgi:hypothetical protein
VKIFGMNFDPPQRPSEADLRDIVSASDARLSQHSTVDYRPAEPCAVVVEDLRKGAALGIPPIPDAGFPVPGDTKE